MFQAPTEPPSFKERDGLFTFHLMVRGELKAKQWEFERFPGGKIEMSPMLPIICGSIDVIS
uniref:Uncharacterized protein n=1 Tax=Utricularia reniformis TaxID=192314 RepID=A0A1Y0B0N2_9LAMI|nr:hypothetical protein AEK19_MT0752 [Utricularia reniformis]ART30995.1 hypothetical protein AEK19_MT0752 [Utricularia reniformis]